MGLFKRNKNDNITPKSVELPPVSPDGVIILPASIISLNQEQITKLIFAHVKKIVVSPGAKRFSGDLSLIKTLEEVELPEGLLELNVNSLRSVSFNIPSTIKRLGKNNFPNVENLELPEGLESIDVMFASHNNNLKSVVIPGSLKSIPSYAFNQCHNLERVIIKEGVEKVKSDSFSRTNGLKYIEIPSTLKGQISFSMDPRGDEQFFEKEKQELTIQIKRAGKSYTIKTIRGECPYIIMDDQIININDFQLDCSQYESGEYSFNQGTLTPIRTNTPNPPIKPEIKPIKTEIDSRQEEIDLIFQKAYKEHIIPREDFQKISSSEKIAIRKRMRELFNLQIEHNIELNVSYEAFDYMFNKAIKELGIIIPEHKEEPKVNKRLEDAKDVLRSKFHNIDTYLSLTKKVSDESGIHYENKTIHELEMEREKIYQVIRLIKDDPEVKQRLAIATQTIYYELIRQAKNNKVNPPGKNIK